MTPTDRGELSVLTYNIWVRPWFLLNGRGARIERLNWLADPSEKGLRQLPMLLVRTALPASRASWQFLLMSRHFQLSVNRLIQCGCHGPKRLILTSGAMRFGKVIFIIDTKFIFKIIISQMEITH